jgi:hypothetical protein
MPQSSVDLASIFQSVTQALAENQPALDQADTRNQDHGSNMVQTFQTITEALEKKKGGSDSAALKYAAKTLAKSATSSSGQQYAQNLTQAASQITGKKVDAQGALQLLQTLIGGGQASQPAGDQAAGGGDMLSSLLGGLAGGEAPAQGASAAGGGDMLGALLGGLTGGEAPAQGASAAGGGDMLSSLLGGLAGGEAPAQGASAAGGGDMLGSLLGGLAGGQAPAQGAQGGLGLENLLAAGMAFAQAKQGGGGNAQALVQALMAGSGMGNSAHRTQSTQVVITSFLQALGALGGKQ